MGNGKNLCARARVNKPARSAINEIILTKISIAYALQLAQTIPDDGMKAWALESIALSLHEARETDRAAELLDRALELGMCGKIMYPP